MTHWEDLKSGNGEEKDFATPVWEIVVNHGTAPKDRIICLLCGEQKKIQGLSGKPVTVKIPLWINQ